jgi:hypothetical protein
MSRFSNLVYPIRWPAWPPRLYRIARHRIEAEARRRQMQRLYELDPRFAADIGLTTDEVERGGPAA